MKNLLLLFILISTTTTSLAKGDDPFQGTVSYTITYEGEGSEFLEMVSFGAYEYYFGDQKLRMELEGGMAYLMGDFVIDQAKGTTFMVDDLENIAYTIKEEEGETETSTDGIEVEKTKKKEKIQGYKCFQYLVTVKTDSTESVSEYWTTTDIEVNANEKIGLTSPLYVEGVEGFPLKIVSYFEGITMTQVATAVDEYKPSASVFEIPSTYEIKDISESPLMKMVEKAEEEE